VKVMMPHMQQQDWGNCVVAQAVAAVALLWSFCCTFWRCMPQTVVEPTAGFSWLWYRPTRRGGRYLSESWLCGWWCVAPTLGPCRQLRLTTNPSTTWLQYQQPQLRHACPPPPSPIPDVRFYEGVKLFGQDEEYRAVASEIEKVPGVVCDGLMLEMADVAFIAAADGTVVHEYAAGVAEQLLKQEST